MLDVNLIISHKYPLFAVNCTNAEALPLPLTQLLGSTVSVLFFQCCNISSSTEHRGDNMKRGQRVCPRVN